MTEQRLRNIFEYQRFENNERLSAMLSEALERYDHDGEGEISDEEAGLLNAAGSTTKDFPADKGKRL